MENAAYYSLIVVLSIGYLTAVAGWKVRLLRRSAMLVNYIGLASCGLAIIYTNLDKSWMGWVLLQLALQNSYFVNVLQSKTSSR